VALDLPAVAASFMNRRAAFALFLFATGAVAGPFDGDSRPDAIMILTVLVFVPVWFLVLGISARKKYYNKSDLLGAYWFGVSRALVATPILWILMVILIYANYDS
jgi:hypothetical protein